MQKDTNNSYLLQQKNLGNDDVGIHHGEAGIALFGAGTISSAFSYGEKNQKALNASLFAIGIGAGFAIHDHKDAHKWFRSRKNFA